MSGRPGSQSPPDREESRKFSISTMELLDPIEPLSSLYTTTVPTRRQTPDNPPRPALLLEEQWVESHLGRLFLITWKAHKKAFKEGQGYYIRDIVEGYGDRDSGSGRDIIFERLMKSHKAVTIKQVHQKHMKQAVLKLRFGDANGEGIEPVDKEDKCTLNAREIEEYLKAHPSGDSE